MEQTNSGAAMPAKRPQFLTVLCILTFIGSGIGIIGSIMGYMAAMATSAMMGVAGDMAGSADMSAMPGMEDAMAAANAMVQYAFIILLVGIVGAILCLVGAIMMWKQKKTGFYLYAVGELVPPIISMVLVGMAGMGALGLLGFIVPIAFIVMYGMNLKHMN
jgi:hypothetical protein